MLGFRSSAALDRPMLRGSKRSVGRSRWGTLGFALCCLLALLAVTPAAAQDGGWVIRTFDVQLAVQANGDVLVTEDIAVDFGLLEKHGIYRDIPVRYDYSSTQQRRIRIEDVSVQGDPGTPDDLVVLEQGRDLHLRIGSPSRTVSGPHRYHLAYRVVGALNAFQTHDELYWNVTGSRWEVPIQRATARVSGPTAVTRADCYTGPKGSTEPCPEADLVGGVSRYRAGPINPGEDLTVVAAFPVGSIQVPAPELVSPSESESFPGGGGLRGTPMGPWLLLVGGLTVLLGVAVARFIARRLEAASVHGALEAKPPDQLRPAQLGFLLHRECGVWMIAATLVDLAMRGYLSISHEPKEGVFGWSDWQFFHRTHSETPGEPPLREYERALYEALFPNDVVRSVSLSALESTFREHSKRVCRLIHEDARAQGWFPLESDSENSSTVASELLRLTAVSLVLVCMFYALLAWGSTELFMAFVAGIVVLWRRMKPLPRRMPAGTAMLRRARPFREFIRTAPTRREQLASQQDLFGELLPYAIAFGLQKDWARAFPELSVLAAVESPQGRWLRGPALSQATDVIALMTLMTAFNSSVGSALAKWSLPTGSFGSSGSAGSWSSGGSGSSGGGSSGGGAGGGGGGSW